MITPQLRAHPDVVKLRSEIYAAGRNWEAALDIAAVLIQLDPEDPIGWVHRSYALSELKPTTEAPDNLLPVVDKFPITETIPCNLASYECQFGRLEQAKDWLEKAFALGDARKMKLPEPRLSWLKQAHQWRPLLRACLASTTFMDSQIGRILDTLDSIGRRDDTIIVLWSDNPWHLGEKDITGKNSLWDRSTRMPLIFAGPGAGQGTQCSQPAELLDVYPTLVELCGLPTQRGVEGHSLLTACKQRVSTVQAACYSLGFR